MLRCHVPYPLFPLPKGFPLFPFPRMLGRGIDGYKSKAGCGHGQDRPGREISCRHDVQCGGIWGYGLGYGKSALPVLIQFPVYPFPALLSGYHRICRCLETRINTGYGFMDWNSEIWIICLFPICGENSSILKLCYICLLYTSPSPRD